MKTRDAQARAREVKTAGTPMRRNPGKVKKRSLARKGGVVDAVFIQTMDVAVIGVGCGDFKRVVGAAAHEDRIARRCGGLRPHDAGKRGAEAAGVGIVTVGRDIPCRGRGDEAETAAKQKDGEQNEGSEWASGWGGPGHGG